MQTATKTNGHDAPAPPIKICGREGCGKKLTERNESGFCQKHFYDSKRGAPAAPRAKHARRKVTREPFHAEHVDQPRLALQVSEAQLNKYLLGLSFEDKQKLANYFLASVDPA